MRRKTEFAIGTRGQALAEYGVILAFLVVVALIGLGLVSGSIQGMLQSAGTAL